MTKPLTTTALAAGLGLVAVALSGAPAGATNGYLGICVGAKNCGMAGAGVALPQDATSSAINPALMGRVKDQVTVSPGWFHPVRSLDRSNSNNGAVPKVDETSMMENFIEGAAGVNYRLNPEITVGVSAVGSGGMHTKYATGRTITGQGAGDSSVRYRLAHIKPTVAWTPNDWSAYGASVNIGWSDFKSNMATLPNFAETAGGNHKETAYGIGFSLGGLWDVSEDVTLGANLSSPTWFDGFDTYSDLFIGSLDVPANGTLGLVYRATPATEIALDIKYVAWGTVFPIANAPGQGGFGWESKPVFMVGVQHDLDEEWTVRAGYNYGPSPIPDNNVFANGLFPAVVEHHIAVGTTYAPQESAWEFSGSFFYALKNEQTENGTGDNFSQMGQGVSVDMWQMGAQVGITYTF